jgi:hypothetical protein
MACNAHLPTTLTLLDIGNTIMPRYVNYTQGVMGLRSFTDHSVSHVRRSCNGVVHVLANESCTNKFCNVWSVVPPVYIVTFWHPRVRFNIYAALILKKKKKTTHRGLGTKPSFLSDFENSYILCLLG